MNIIHSNLYAQGTSKHVLAFNCVQRSHQQIFETFTQTVVSGLVGAVTFPLCTSISTMMYALGESVCFYFESNVVLLVNLQCKNIDTATKKRTVLSFEGICRMRGRCLQTLQISSRYVYVVWLPRQRHIRNGKLCNDYFRKEDILDALLDTTPTTTQVED